MRGLNNRNDDKLSKLDELSADNEKVEKDTFGVKLKALRDKFKLGPHHRMERFTIMFGSTLTLMLVFVVMGFFAYQSKVGNLEENTPIITNEFRYSLSGQKGTVNKVLSNSDQTDVIFLIEMRSIDNMSIDTKNYELFITNNKRKGMTYEPEVTFGLFGSTGYGFIRFENDEPIPQDILNVTIRANEKLTTGKSSTPDEEDGSFAEHDQARIVINPGANGIDVADGVDSFDTSDPINLYRILVAQEKDEEIHEKIDTQLQFMRDLLAKEREYINRIETAGYVAPERPWFINGDEFDEDGIYYSNNDIVGTHDINYQGVTIEDGYLHQVLDDVSKFDKYVEEKRLERENRDTEKYREQVDRILMVKAQDGTEVLLENVRVDTSTSAQVTMKESVESLETVWREYLRAKTVLQQELVNELIVLDANVLSQDVNFSSITGSDYVIFY